MTDDNLSEFLNERVLATRQVHHVAYPLNMDVPSTGVMLDCPEDSLAVVLLPTFVKDTLHLELHCFIDGERIEPMLTRHLPPNGQLELVLRRPFQPTKLYDSDKEST